MTEKILEYLTREQSKVLWTESEVNSDYLIESIHGDGQQLVYFETMDSRPFHYIIRVDSGIDLSNEHNEILSGEDAMNYGSFAEMLMQLIEEECDNIESYEEREDGLYYNPKYPEEKGIEWRFPMFSLGAGYTYGVIDTLKVSIAMEGGNG